jgi:hypothetical protein
VSISDLHLRTALEGVIRGDLSGLAVILSADHDAILDSAEDLGIPLVVPRTAATAVLRGLFDGVVAPEAAQQWAWFVSVGFVANRSSGPIRPVEIDFEAAWEDAIAAAVSRLDEIGDAIDGEVTSGEILDLLQLLGEA